MTRTNLTALTIPVVLYQLWKRQEWKAGILAWKWLMADQNFMSVLKRRRVGKIGSKVVKKDAVNALLRVCMLGGH